MTSGNEQTSAVASWLVLLAMLAVAVPSFHVAVARESGPTGLYTAAQANRGSALYAQYCSACHGKSLTGADEATALTGPRFISNWNRRSAADLFVRIRTTMPPGQPNQLTRQQTADVLAYLLNYNKVPEGPVELPVQSELLKRIELVFEPSDQ